MVYYQCCQVGVVPRTNRTSSDPIVGSARTLSGAVRERFLDAVGEIPLGGM